MKKYPRTKAIGKLGGIFVETIRFVVDQPQTCLANRILLVKMAPRCVGWSRGRGSPVVPSDHLI